MFIGEGPARDEEREGRNFAGRAGKEYDRHYLPLAGLLRSEVYTTNACRSPRSGFFNPSPQEALQCSQFHLPKELRYCRPEVVVPMGAVACSLFDTPIDLDTEHGLPQTNSLLGGEWEGTVFPVYHPAAGLHEGQWILRLRQDFQDLGRYLRGELVAPTDQYPNRTCRLLHTAQDVLDAGLILEDPPEIAVDTEGTKEDPFCLSFAWQPDSGYVVRPSTPALDLFVQWYTGWLYYDSGGYERAQEPLVILHPYLHDNPVLTAMGCPPITKFFDTMQAAYVLGYLPQGLKALSYRLLGMRMRSYEEVTYPHSRQVAYGWLERASEECRGQYTYQHTLRGGPRKGQQEERVWVDAPKGQVKTWRKVQGVLRDRDKRAAREGGEVDPWKRWDGWHAQDQALLFELMREELPQPSLAHVPEQEAVDYAGQDAIGTLRLKRVLEGKVRGFRREYL
jgi:DNA polymerase